MTTRRRPRMKRWPLLLDDLTRRNLDIRAAAHGVKRPVFVRALINGHRPGADPGSLAAQADAWWDSRSPERRISIWRNHASAATREAHEPDDQLTIFDSQEAQVGTEPAQNRSHTTGTPAAGAPDGQAAL